MSDRRKTLHFEPLHEQVLNMLRARIAAGEWGPGKPLPAEAALSRELAVSVGTVRKAMDQLTRESLVIRERGRGTFVRGDGERRSKSVLAICDRGGQQIVPQIRLDAFDHGEAEVEEIAALRLGTAAKPATRVLRLEREWRTGDVLLCRERIAVEEMRFPGLHRDIDACAVTLFSIYEHCFRVKVDRVQWIIGASMSRRTCGADTVAAVSGPTLPIVRTAFDARGVPVELCSLQVQLDHCFVQIST